MLIYRRSVRRDATLIIIGAALTHLYSLLNRQQPTQILVNNVSIPPMEKQERPIPLATIQELSTPHGSAKAFQSRFMSTNSDSDVSTIAPTTLLTHAPGWTVLENLYMSNGTFFIVTDTPQDFPKIRLMISKPLILENTAKNIAAREPTADDMAFLTMEEANKRWGEVKPGRKNRISTVLVNDPDQFLGHYYHFVGELFFGIQAIWYGTFSSSSNRFNSNSTPNPPATDALPPIHRVIFARASSIAWRDFPGFNYYFLRAAFPSTTVEVEDDWEDRAEITATGKRAWRFPLLLLTDRSASNRGHLCGTVTQRNAAEAVALMRSKTKQKSGGGKEREEGNADIDANADMAAWWNPVRDRLFEFADAGHDDVKGLPKPRVAAVHQVGERNQVVLGGGSSGQPRLPTPRSIVITYISRQSAGGRMLTRISHEELVSALEELAERKGWEFNVVQAEFLTHDEQLKLMARTTILLGVHGNGLTHVLMMQPTRFSTVIEIFFPGGFCHDYQWTATHGLGIKHYAVWNDTAHTEGEGEGKPKVNYPSGFQGNSIPVHGPFVSKLIEDHIERRR